ncbi:hypothetical protein Barb4_01620 [Bacteroidales bacterium Barb4]|nr:hypothetical protein Barb4_01620 [Bacteroidales bacterium Barb4]
MTTKMKRPAAAVLAAVVLGLFFACSSGEDNGKSEQTITFNAPAPHNLSERFFELDATASSGLPVSYDSSDPSVAAINGRTASLLKKGTTTITASQAGNSAFFEAPRISRLLTVNEDNNVNKKEQTITFDLGTTELNFTVGELTLEATASSGLPVTFTDNHINVVIDGYLLKLTYTGLHYDDDITITASQTGNDEYNAAPNVSKILHIKHDE